MDPRYSHPEVTRQWGPVTTHTHYATIHSATARFQRQHHVIPQTVETEALEEPLVMLAADTVKIKEIERRTKHDVAAYIEHARGRYNELMPHSGRWLHYGLTSSDLVDTAQALRFKAMQRLLDEEVTALTTALISWSVDRHAVLGRTHGQAAEPMPLAARADHWAAMVQQSVTHLVDAVDNMRVGKLSGPVGTFAHTPAFVEREACAQLGLAASDTASSQIVSRIPLATWASAAANLVNVCAKIALDLRLMNLLGEVSEPQSRGQVGSSVMPHKNNPIRAEQIAGMARLAGGYAQMLQPLDLWLERDISHSSVERVAVPDLWHVLMHTLRQTAILLTQTQRAYGVMQRNLVNAPEALSVRYLNQQLWLGREHKEARDAGLRWALNNRPDADSIRWFGRNYKAPGAQ